MDYASDQAVTLPDHILDANICCFVKEIGGFAKRRLALKSNEM